MSGPADDIAALDVIPGWRTSTGTHMAGLRITLAPGWKTYWRAPGDAGIPPQFSWARSSNIADAQIHWPVPEVFDQSGLRSIGYHDSVVIPIELQPVTTGSDIRLAGQIDIGVCDEICVPVSLSFDTMLPVAGTRDSGIVAALIDRPLSQSEAGVGEVICTIAPVEDGLRVTATMQMPSAGSREVVIIEAGDPQVWVSEPLVARHGDTLTATADMVHVNGAGFALNRSRVRITVLGSQHAVDIQGCAAG